jgi:hypothetical protein
MANNSEINKKVREAESALKQIKLQLYDPEQIDKVNKKAVLAWVAEVKRILNRKEIEVLLRDG